MQVLEYFSVISSDSLEIIDLIVYHSEDSDALTNMNTSCKSYALVVTYAYAL